MKFIKITKGYRVMVDNKDHDFLKSFSWSFKKSGSKKTFYAYRGKSKNHKAILMHRLIMSDPKNMIVDHKNGNGLDNRRKNLRVCTQTENARNAIKRSKASSKYKGVCKIPNHRSPKKWLAQISKLGNGKPKKVGFFLTEKEAAIAYNIAAKKYHGEFARLNIL